MKPIKTVDLVLHRKSRKLLFRVYAVLRKKTIIEEKEKTKNHTKKLTELHLKQKIIYATYDDFSI